jgi:hypothetical protein
MFLLQSQQAQLGRRSVKREGRGLVRDRKRQWGLLACGARHSASIGRQRRVRNRFTADSVFEPAIYSSPVQFWSSFSSLTRILCFLE